MAQGYGYGYGYNNNPNSVNVDAPVVRQQPQYGASVTYGSNSVGPSYNTTQPGPAPAAAASKSSENNGITDDPKKWHYTLCGCCHKGCKVANFCCSCWCPCIVEYRIARRLGESCLVPFTYVPYANCAFFPSVQPEMALSTRLRALVGIEQSQCREGCEWVACARCMLCRMLNEMDYRQIDWERG